LANDGSHQDHILNNFGSFDANDGSHQDHILNNFGSFDGATRQVRREDNQHNRELTPNEVPIKAVAFVGKRTGSAFLADGMAIHIQMPLDRPQSDRSALACLHHGKPKHR
jgi:hypothetical protein